MFPTLSFKSFKSFARHKIAMISLATVISKPSWRITPLPFEPTPMIISLNSRSFMSIHLLIKICFGSMFNALPWWMWLSIIAQIKLFAVVIAWKSPVKCMLISSIGTTCAYPPPAAPPFIPKFGPKDGSLKTEIAFLPILLSPIAKPTFIVVLPSPVGVGLILVIKINLPSFLSLFFSKRFKSNFALYLPYCS